jgi:hypothetical protein
MSEPPDSINRNENGNMQAMKAAEAKSHLDQICKLVENETTYQSVLLHSVMIAYAIDDLAQPKQPTQTTKSGRKPFSIWRILKPFSSIR